MSSPTLKEVEGKDSENASNSSASNGEGGGNNSDNSALVSFCNTSFGFNFESDTGYNNSSGSNSPDEGDSDQGERKPKPFESKPCEEGTKVAPASSYVESPQAAPKDVSLSNDIESPPHLAQTPPQQPEPLSQPEPAFPEAVKQESSATAPTSATTAPAPMSAGAAAAAKLQLNAMKAPPTTTSDSNAMAAAGTHRDAADTAVASLNQIAINAVERTDAANEEGSKRGLKRKPDDDNGGYNSYGEGESATNDAQVASPFEVKSSAAAAPASGKGAKGATGGKKKKLDDNKREERNAREKERSFRISKQINELRALLSSGGVIVPKGTKSSVLTEAANYIRMLQQHQYRSEIDRHQLVQQVQRIGSGALGQEAAQAVRHVAAKNGVWSLGNFGGVPPRSAMMYHQPNTGPTENDDQGASNNNMSNTIGESDYRHVFNTCTIGMAIASMGGAFIDCNKFFCQIANSTKQEICSLTVFNLTARQDLQAAFDLISQMLSAPLDPTVTNTSCILRGALKNRPDVGLSVKLIKGHDGVAKCFCITLIQNPTSPFDTSRPIPALVAVTGQGTLVSGVKDPSQQGMNPAPAYTTG